MSPLAETKLRIGLRYLPLYVPFPVSSAQIVRAPWIKVKCEDSYIKKEERENSSLASYHYKEEKMKKKHWNERSQPKRLPFLLHIKQSIWEVKITLPLKWSWRISKSCLMALWAVDLNKEITTKRYNLHLRKMIKNDAFSKEQKPPIGATKLRNIGAWACNITKNTKYPQPWRYVWAW